MTAEFRYIHQADWDDAKRVAEEHDPESLVDILVGQVISSRRKKLVLHLLQMSFGVASELTLYLLLCDCLLNSLNAKVTII